LWLTHGTQSNIVELILEERITQMSVNVSAFKKP